MSFKDEYKKKRAREAAKKRKAKREKKELERMKEMAKLGLYLTSHPMMGYDKRYIHFIYAGARGRGKSVLSLDAAIGTWKKVGPENCKIFFFRLAEKSIEALLANNGAKSVDALLIDKYDMHITRKGNIIYNDGKKLMELYSLISAAKNKGLNLYDWAYLNKRPIDPKTGEPVKRYIYLILDEFQIAEGLERSSAASKSTAELFKMYTEIILRDQEFLDYPAVRCVYAANNVSECSTFTAEMWGYYMPPGDFRIKKCPRKNAVFFNVPNSKAYIDKRERSMMGSITKFDDDPNYSNKIAVDFSMIKPKKTKMVRVTTLVKFSKRKDDWFCIYDGLYVRKYQGETVNKKLVVPMTRHTDDVFIPELAQKIFELYDTQIYKYSDLLSLATFRAKMKGLKAK